MTDAIASEGKPPLDVEMGTGDAAGPAFQTSFVGHADVVFFQPVHICRAEVETWLVRAFS